LTLTQSGLEDRRYVLSTRELLIYNEIPKMNGLGGYVFLTVKFTNTQNLRQNNYYRYKTRRFGGEVFT